jgi:hypothetical protein
MPRIPRPQLRLLIERRNFLQRQIRQRRPEIQPGPPNHDRRLPRPERLIDRPMRQRHVLMDREVLRHRHDPKQLMRQDPLLLRRRSPREHVDPFVNLQRIAVDRDRILAPLSKQSGQLHAHTGLPHAGRPEHRKHLPAPNHQGHVRKAANGLYFFVARSSASRNLITEKVERGALRTCPTTSGTSPIGFRRQPSFLVRPRLRS